ncbi:hypothetical protein ACVIOG_006753 [Rhizobium leguminosarum]
MGLIAMSERDLQRIEVLWPPPDRNTKPDADASSRKQGKNQGRTHGAKSMIAEVFVPLHLWGTLASSHVLPLSN